MYFSNQGFAVVSLMDSLSFHVHIDLFNLWGITALCTYLGINLTTNSETVMSNLINIY